MFEGSVLQLNLYPWARAKLNFKNDQCDILLPESSSDTDMLKPEHMLGTNRIYYLVITLIAGRKSVQKTVLTAVTWQSPRRRSMKPSIRCFV